MAGSRFAAHAAGSGGTLSGWAWSSNIGWLSFNSADTGAGGGPYSVSVDGNGYFSGYAWSPNIGWISFNQADTSGCANPSVRASVNMTSGAVTGWAKAIAADNNGWNGCIQLSDSQYFTSPSGNGVSMNPTTGVFSGYAWGSTNVGWLQFSPSTSVSPVILCQTGDTTCPPDQNPTDLAFQAQDIGAGSPGSTGNWFSNITYTIPSLGGSVSVPIKWTPNDAINIKTASTSPFLDILTDWGENSGLTTSPGGHLFSATTTESLVFTNSGPNPITKVLILSYFLSGVGAQSRTVTITINPYTTVSNSCTQPSHTEICTVKIDKGSAKIWGSSSSCSATSPSCEFYCSAEYVLKGTSCTKSSIQEI